MVPSIGAKIPFGIGNLLGHVRVECCVLHKWVWFRRVGVGVCPDRSLGFVAWTGFDRSGLGARITEAVLNKLVEPASARYGSNLDSSAL